MDTYTVTVSIGIRSTITTITTTTTTTTTTITTTTNRRLHHHGSWYTLCSITCQVSVRPHDNLYRDEKKSDKHTKTQSSFVNTKVYSFQYIQEVFEKRKTVCEN